MRARLVPQALRWERDFRWRGGDVSRLEGLADAVFALALTLLVVSLQVPTTFGDLMAAFAQVPVFAVCFSTPALCWYYHYQFHRRYGLEDLFTIVANAALLFTVLLYVYPRREGALPGGRERAPPVPTPRTTRPGHGERLPASRHRACRGVSQDASCRWS